MSQAIRADSERAKSERAYDFAADYYDRWAWQSFWRENEFPIVLSRLLAGVPVRAVLDIGAGTGAFLSHAATSLPPQACLVGVDVIPLPDHFECATASSPLSKHRSPGSDSIQIDLGSV
jgi:ubiquinone/menaquinone biosynthesis C-methylase UbiE